MTPLRHQMIEAMRQRGFSIRTHRSYLAAVSELARYYQRSPARLSPDELQAFFVHLAQERGLSGASCRLYLNAVRFLYLQVLSWPAFEVELIVPKRAQRIPELLTRAEVARILAACTNPKHRMLLETCYGCGLRVSEVCRLRVRDIDGERHLLRIEQGKGAKDRAVSLSPRLLDHLRRYWRAYRPRPWLFPHGQRPERALGISTAQKVFTRAKRHAAWPRWAASTACAMPTPPISWRPACRSISSNSCWAIATCNRRCAMCTGCRGWRRTCRVRAM